MQIPEEIEKKNDAARTRLPEYLILYRVVAVRGGLAVID